MKSKSKSKSKFNFIEFEKKLKSIPDEAYKQLISKQYHYRFGEISSNFWLEWDLKKASLLQNASLDLKYYIERVNQLEFIVQIEKDIIERKIHLKTKNSDLKLSKKQFLTSILDVVNGYDPEHKAKNLKVRISEILQAYKLILDDGWFVEVEEHTEVTDEKLVNNLLSIYLDIKNLNKLFEYFILGDLEISLSYILTKDGKSIPLNSLLLPENTTKSTNKFTSSLLKQIIKDRYFQKEAEQKVEFSQIQLNKIKGLEAHLMEPEIFLSSACWPLFMYIQTEIAGLESYKSAITNIYFPQEQIDVNKVPVTFEENDVLILHVIYAIGALTSNSASFASADKFKNNGILLLKQSILEIFSNYEEWRNLNLTPKEQEHILRLLVSVNKKLPYSALIEVADDEFLLVPLAFLENRGYSRIFYDYVISDLLFSSNKKEKTEKIETASHTLREKALCSFLEEKICNTFPKSKTKASFEWPAEKEFWGRKGEADIVIFFPDENLLFVVEIKLYNSLSKSIDGKLKWLEEKIFKGEKSAVGQLQKDLNFFRNAKAIPHITRQLSIDPTKTFKPEIVPLIVTDTFFIDQTSVTINLKDEKARCISLFQLMLLLEGKTGALSNEVETIPSVKGGEWLYNWLFNNHFWKGIEKQENLIKEYYGVTTDTHSLSLSI